MPACECRMNIDEWFVNNDEPEMKAGAPFHIG
jgi:hypothetical protein